MSHSGKTRAELRDEKLARGECSECSSPRAVKPSGELYRLCTKHRATDTARAARKRRSLGIPVRGE